MIKIISTSLCRRLPLLVTLVVCWLALGSAPLCAQNIQHTENKPDLALRSDLRVDPSTLGMSLSIPLASYPGRAGHGLPVAITYSSKALRLDFQGVDYTPVTGAKTWTGVKFGERSTAGWTSTLNPPRVEFTGMGQYYDGQGHTACPDVCVPGQNTVGDHYIKRIHVHMPDGSSHELRLDDEAHLFPLEPFTGTFQAVDGSRMRFESNAGTASVLYLPDGSRYLFGPYNIGNELTATNYIDRNGNTLSYNAGTRQWTDTLGRVIADPLPTNPAANTETYFFAKLVGGLDATYTLRWKYLADVLTPDPSTGQPPPLRYSGDYKCAHNSYQNVSPSLFTSSFDTRVCVEQDQFGNPAFFNPVVLAEVVLPTGKFYRFTYTVYGEIDKVLLTTGATDRFRYNQVATLSSSTGPYSQTNRGVIERRVSATGTGTDESLWSYAIISTNPYTVRTTRPDLSYSERLLHRSRYTGVGEDFARFEFDDARMGMAYEERSYNSSGLMLRRELSKWVEGGTAGGAARDPKVIKQVSIILDGPASNALTATTVNRYEQASQPQNLTSATEYGFDTSMGKTTAQTAGVDSFNPADSLAVRTIETAYLDNADYNARNLVSLPISVTTRTGLPVSGQVKARSEMLYDESAFAALPCGATAGWTDPGAVARANVTSVKSWLDTLGAFTNPNAYLATHTQYDQCGSVRKIWDARDTSLSNPAQIEYSHQFAYPTLNTSADPDGAGPLSALTTATEYDVDTGLVTATIDANGQRTTFSYNDPLNRLKQVVRAATDAVAKNQTTYVYDDTARTITATTDLNTYGDNLLKTLTIYDGVGRATETRTFEGGTNYIAAQQQYDTSGRVFKTSNPFRPWQSETPVWTTTAYDALSRVLTVTTPDNSVVSTSYSGNTVTITDQAQKKRKSVTDALGRMIEVYEDPNGLNYQTSYAYDVLDNLTTVTQGVQTRTFVYDSLKRLKAATNPESGTVAYNYDNNSNLTQKTDARGVVTTYAYDALNRSTTIDYSDTPSINPDVTRFYDGAVNGKGRFWYFYSGGSNLEHTAIDNYDALGRPTVQRQLFKVNGVWAPPSYQTTRSYNLAGSVTSQTYPSGHTVSYSYDSAGRTSSFRGNLGDGTTRTYSTGVDYDAFGGIRQEQFGTQTPLYHKKHYNKRGQLYDIRVSTVPWATDQWNWNRGCVANYYSSNYAWEGDPSTPAAPDNNGNVLRQQHWVPTDDAASSYNYTQDTYTYDSLNRIQSAIEVHGTPTSQSGQDFAQMFTYDRWGNRTINPASWGTGINTKQFTVDTARNRLGVPTGQSGVMSYDNAGNLTTDTYTGVGTRTYDAENKMITATDNTGQTSRYTYDADGHRVRRQIASSQEEWQIYGMDGELLAEYRASSPASAPEKEYGYRGGQLLITATGRFNVALAANGAVATASTAHTCCGFSTTGAINGNYRGPWGNGEGWNDATPDVVPDWIQVDFAGSKSIDEIDVFSLHDNYTQENTPTETQTFTLYGLLAFDVQYWNGSSWTTVPGGSVTGNNKVWRKFTFSPITTSKIRVYINQVPDSWSRVVEIQAFGTSAGGEKVQWLVPDHLGTPRIILDQTGSLSSVRRHDYLPFGEELFAGTGGRTVTQGYTGTDAVRQQFTSKERDIETTLDYSIHRYYASGQGRFTSVDPFTINLERQAEGDPRDGDALLIAYLIEPQRWNMYAYAVNDPLRYVDPTGDAIQLSNDPKERAKQLADLQGMVGPQAAGYLYVNAVTQSDGSVKYFVGIYDYNPETGGRRSFEQVNNVAGELGPIIRDPHIVQLNIVDSGTEVIDDDHKTWRIAPVGQGSPGLTGYFHGTLKIFLLDPAVNQGIVGAQDMEGNRPAQATAEQVLGHELGRARAKMTGDTDEDAAARRVENKVLLLKNPHARLRKAELPPTRPKRR